MKTLDDVVILSTEALATVHGGSETDPDPADSALREQRARDYSQQGDKIGAYCMRDSIRSGDYAYDQIQRNPQKYPGFAGLPRSTIRSHAATDCMVEGRTGF
jgi:hypothetical protein